MKGNVFPVQWRTMISIYLASSHYLPDLQCPNLLEAILCGRAFHGCRHRDLGMVWFGVSFVTQMGGDFVVDRAEYSR
jgi:hypothetical protein